MPSTGYTLADNEITIRYRTPYISTALNERDVGIVPMGVYEGFNPVPSTALAIRLEVGSSGRSSAVVQSDLNPDTQVNVHIGGNIDLDLSGYTSKWVVVALVLNYAYPAVTTGTIEIYARSTETVPSSACVLAEVFVPPSGVIPREYIQLTGRQLPFETRGRDARPMSSIVQNGKLSLVDSDDDTVLPYWERYILNNATVVRNTTGVVSPTGGNVFEVRKTSSGSTSIGGTIYQGVGVGLPPNRRIRVKVALWQIQAPTAGNPTILFQLKTSTGALTDRTFSVSTSVTGSWVEFDQVIDLTENLDVPSDESVSLYAVHFNLGNFLGGTTTYVTSVADEAVYYFSDFDVQIEQYDDASDEPIASSVRENLSAGMQIYTGSTVSERFVRFGWLGSSIFRIEPNSSYAGFGEFSIRGNTAISGSLVITTTLTVSGAASALSLETATIEGAGGTGTLALGAGGSEGVIIGRSGHDTTVRGNLIVEGTTTSTDSETVLISDSHLYLNSGYWQTNRLRGGLVVNSRGDVLTTTVTGAYTASTIQTPATPVFQPYDFIQISGSDKNDGIYEVDTHAAGVLTIKGPGAASDFVQNTLVAGASDGARVDRVSLSLLLTDTVDGAWEVAQGTNSGSITFQKLVVSGGGGGGGTNEIAFFDGAGVVSDAGLYRDASNVLFLEGIDRSSAGTLTIGTTADSSAISIGTGTGGDITLSRPSKSVNVEGSLQVNAGAEFNAGNVRVAPTATSFTCLTQASLSGLTTFSNTVTVNSGLYANFGVNRSISSSGTLELGTIVSVTGVDIGTGASSGPINVGNLNTTDITLEASNSITLQGSAVEFVDGIIASDIWPSSSVPTFMNIGGANTTTLNLGSAATTAVNIAKAGTPTNVLGNLEVAGHVYTDSRFDIDPGGSLDIGTIGATEIVIARGGVQTKVEGELLVDEEITASAVIYANGGVTANAGSFIQLGAPDKIARFPGSYSYKGGDTARSSTTSSIDPDLQMTLPFSGSLRYEFEYTLVYETSALQHGIRFGLARSSPANSSMFLSQHFYATCGELDSTGVGLDPILHGAKYGFNSTGNNPSLFSAPYAYVSAATTEGIINGRGVLSFPTSSGSSPVQVGVFWASLNSSTTVTVKAGSSFRVFAIT